MITINKSDNSIDGYTNSVFMTLTENETGTSSTGNFLLYLENKLTQEEKTLRIIDGSSYSCRFNQFDIVESLNENLTSSVVNLTAGRWYYIAYQDDNDISNLTVSMADPGTVLEKGIMLVNGTVSYLDNIYQ